MKMKKTLLILLINIVIAGSAMAFDDVDEIIVEEDPYIGVTIDFSQFGPMVSFSNLSRKLTPSQYVINTNRLITSLANAKTAQADLFKNNQKMLEYLPVNSKFKVKKLVKTAVYKDNTPDEYTTYILEDPKGVEYAIADFELKNISRVSLNSYELGLIESFNRQANYARVVIYFEKPPLYKNKTAPYDQKELNSVFDYFLSKIKNYPKDRVLLSKRNFRLSMSIPITTLAYLIAEEKNLYIEDIEVMSLPKKVKDEENYKFAKVRRPVKENNPWYNN